MATIAVLGGGIGGLTQAYELRKELGKQHDIIVISDSDHFEFTPSNPWLAVGWRKPDQIVVELPDLLQRHGIRFDARGAKRVHPARNAIELNDGNTVDYDYLVIATGPKLAFDEVPGLGPHGGHTQSVCKTGHAAVSHDDFEKLCADPGPVIVGAAPGASCFGPAYEFAMIMDTDLRNRKIRDKVPMTFVTSEPYVGHLGLGGVGDTKGLMESAMRERTIKWVTNAKVQKFEADKVHVLEVNEDGSDKKTHELPFKYSMMLPAFRGIPAVRGIEGLVNPRGFVIVDKHQRNPKYPNIYGVGVCIAIPPYEPTPVPVGVPKTGYMIESMVTATAHNIRDVVAGKEPEAEATWNAICLADFGDTGVAFLAQPQNPPRNVNWSGQGKWVHLAKVAFEKYFLGKVRRGMTEPYFEKAVMQLLAMSKLKPGK